jgi:hypothetical protein
MSADGLETVQGRSACFYGDASKFLEQIPESILSNLPNDIKYITRGHIVKLTTTYNAINDIATTPIIDRIDPEYKWHLRAPTLYGLDRTPETYNLFKKCNIYTKNADSLSLLFQENGGFDLYSFAVNIRETDSYDLTDINRFWKNAIILFIGLKQLRSNQFVHGDVTDMNILYNNETGKFKFIDFEMLKTKDNLLRIINEKKYIPKNCISWSYPLESLFLQSFPNILRMLNNKHQKTGVALSYKEDMFKNLSESRCDKNDPNDPIYQLCKTVFHPDDLESKKIKLLADFETMEDTILNRINVKKDNYKRLDVQTITSECDKLVDTYVESVDTYGLGLALSHVLWSCKYKNLINMQMHDELAELFYKMFYPNCYERPTDIDIIISEYNRIMTTYYAGEYTAPSLDNFIPLSLPSTVSTDTTPANTPPAPLPPPLSTIGGKKYSNRKKQSQYKQSKRKKHSTKTQRSTRKTYSQRRKQSQRLRKH